MSEQIFASKAEQSDFFADLLNRGLSLRVRVTGRSMQPFLRGGEIVTIKKVPCAELRIGDLIFFESSQGVLVLHRIVRKKLSDNGAYIFQTRGDGLMSFDGEIHGGSVLGKVLLIEKPSLSGKTMHIKMNSLFYRCMNFSIAVAGFFKTQTWFFLSAALAKRT